MLTRDMENIPNMFDMLLRFRSISEIYSLKLACAKVFDLPFHNALSEVRETERASLFTILHTRSQKLTCRCTVLVVDTITE